MKIVIDTGKSSVKGEVKKAKREIKSLAKEAHNLNKQVEKVIKAKVKENEMRSDLDSLKKEKSYILNQIDVAKKTLSQELGTVV